MVPSIRLVQVPVMGMRPAYPAWRPAPMAAVRANGQTMGQAAGVAALGAIPLLLGAAIGGGMAWVGFSTGIREKGFLSILGYAIGSIGALGAFGGTVSALLWIAGVGAASAAIQKSEQRREEFFRETPATPPMRPETPSFPEFTTESL